MNDREFAPVPAIPAPPDPPPGSSAPPPVTAWPVRIAFALLVPLGFYAETCAGYLATACRPLDLGTNLSWALFVIAVIPFVARAPFVLGYLAIVGAVFAIPERPRIVRNRNRFALWLALIVPTVAAIAGAIVPTRCTLF
jgi:hypothetical protein